MTKNKNLFAVILAVLLVICMLPGAALAEGRISSVPDATPPVTPSVSDETLSEEDASEPEIAEPDGEISEDSDTVEVEIADEAEEAASPESGVCAEPITVNEGEVCFSDSVAFNNGGTVYNNGGIVYNNGGTVYNNLGVCYNNGGTCYNNNGTVYDNGGTVINNGGTVFSNENAAVSDSPEAEDGIDVTEIEDETVDDDIPEGEAVDEAIAEDEAVDEDITDVEELPESIDGTEEAAAVSVDDASSVSEDVASVLDAPVIDLAGGTLGEVHNVSITAAEGSKIHYTLDGTEPDENSKLYRYSFPVSKSTVVKAIAVMDGFENSEVSVAEYAFVEITAPKFSRVAQGYELPDPKAIAVKNLGACSAVVTSVELDEEGAKYFELNTSDGAEIDAGNTDESTWSIRPVEKLETGSYKAIITFTFDSGDTQTTHVSIIVS